MERIAMDCHGWNGLNGLNGLNGFVDLADSIARNPIHSHF
jgi:hypothetical protein